MRSANARCGPVFWGRVLVALMAVTASSSAQADVFHLTSGGSVEGRLVSDENGQYTIRTTIGIVRVAAQDVTRIEKAPSTLEEYEQRLKEATDTAAGQTELAAWCEEKGLRAERLKHLHRALDLDGDYAPARRALAYVRVGEYWVNASGTPKVGAAESDEAGKAATSKPPDEADREQLARALQAQWTQRIRSIKQSMLDSTVDRLVAEGREKILAIRDPLAILPLARVLSEGHVACRRLLVEALGRFAEDEATMNLAVLGLLDRALEVRSAALEALLPRKDTRVVAQYREALSSQNELVLRRAAEALGQLEAREAVPELIGVLTAQRDRMIEVPVVRAVQNWPDVWGQGTVVQLSNGRVVHRPEVGVYSAWTGFNDDVKNEWRRASVTVYRTEVLEALRRITRQNFGFEREQWQTWYEEREE